MLDFALTVDTDVYECYTGIIGLATSSGSSDDTTTTTDDETTTTDDTTTTTDDATTETTDETTTDETTTADDDTARRRVRQTSSSGDARDCFWRNYKPILPIWSFSLMPTGDTATDYVSWSCNDTSEI